MAEEEKAPLLTSENVDNSLTRNRKRPNIFPTEPVRSNAVCADDRIFVNATVTTPSKIEPDVIVAIFVVAFDTRSGICFLESVFATNNYTKSVAFTCFVHLQKL